MKKIVLISFIVVVFLTLTKPLNSSAQQIFGKQLAIEASTASSATPDEPFPNQLKASFETEAKSISRFYIKVDMSSIPENAQIIDGFLNLDQDFCSGEAVDLTISIVTSDWSVDGLTWNTKPGFTSPNVNSRVDCINEVANWNITSIVKELFQLREKNFGIVVYSHEEPSTLDFIRTFEINSENSYILIDYEVGTTTPTPTLGNTNSQSTLKIAGLLMLAILLVVLLGYLVYAGISLVKRKKYQKTKDSGTIEHKEAKSIDFLNSTTDETKPNDS